MKSLRRVILALLCLILIKPLPAQNSLFNNFSDSVFQHLDKSPITTGTLYDRTYPLASLHAFNIQTDTVNSELFEQGYFELYNATYSKNTFLNPDDLTYIRDVKNFENLVPVAVLDYKFNWIDTLAIQNNLISLQNGMFYDVSGRTQNPYIEKRVQMVSPLYDELKPGIITFSFASYLTLNNQSLAVQQIQLSFPNAGTATLLPNGTASLNFSSEGNYTGTITVTYTNGTNFSNICMITTSTSTGGEQRSYRTMSPQGTQGIDVPPCWTREIFSSVLFQGYEENQAYRGHQVLSCYYRLNDPTVSCNNTEQMLRKPIIVVDGFDPTDRRDGAII